MIYLDNAATTPLAKQAYDKMLPYYSDIYANPSELYDYASKSRRAINEARECVSNIIGCDKTEVYFTSGGTESDNQAIIGAAYAAAETVEGNFTSLSRKHIITTEIEHHAVINSCRFLEKNGYDVTYVKVRENGIVDPYDIEKSIRSDTILISVMTANNEIGTIQPVGEIGSIAKKHGILFHTDAVQAFAHIPLYVKEMNIDLLSASAHKCNGPKGVGMLYIRSGVNIVPFHYGGKQERNMRPGTENVPGIVGFGEACRISQSKDNYNSFYIKTLSSLFIKNVFDGLGAENVILNGDPQKRLPGNISFSFDKAEGEAIQIQLDLKGICCSTGSACNAGTTSVSHVISAINVPENYARGTVRFTISDMNTVDEIEYASNTLVEVVRKYKSF